MIDKADGFKSVDMNKIDMRQQEANKLGSSAFIQREVENKTTAGIQKKEINKLGGCETCSTRRYQDNSMDSGVSFQSPTRISPQQASSTVVSHEKEHFTREAVKAEVENKDVLVNSIRIHSAICPECGKAYVSGGETTTVTRTRKNESPSPVEEVQTDGHLLDVGM